MNNRVKISNTNLNIGSLIMSGSHVQLDDWKETLLIDGRPLAVPGANQFVVLPSEIGLQPPSYFTSFPYTGLSLYEEYTASSYIVTGWAVSLGKTGVGPGHLNNLGQLIYAPLTGDFYTRSLTDPDNKTTIASFYINSGEFFSSSLVPQQTISGDTIIGWNIYSGLSGAEDLIVSLRGRYNDINESNISDGVIMSSGDSAISFFLEYGAITGETVLEYYLPNEFVATRWGLYSASTGSSTIGNNDPLTIQVPLSGRFYYRDPKSAARTTITNFSMRTGVYSSFALIGQDVNVLPRKIVGIDIYKGLNNLKNLHIVLGGRAIASANYLKNVVTRDIFSIYSGHISGTYEQQEAFLTGSINILSGYIDTFSGQMTGDFYGLSGFLTGLIEAGNSGVTSVNGSYGAVYIDGLSGIKVGGGYPASNISIEYTSGNFNNIDFSPNLDVDIPHKEGRLFYSADTKTFNGYLDIPDVTLNIGQEEYVRVVNKYGDTLPNGTVVFISGAQGNRPKVWPAIATDNYHVSHLLGITTHDILDNNEGLVTTFGSLGGINTSNFNAGDILYLSDQAAGSITNTPPNTRKIKIGYALSSANNGRIIVIKPEEDIVENYNTIRNLTILRYI